ncbi:MAG: hypothetical protein HRU23_01405 [Gammaproteobacteria bacterium]|nr:hypothetical protein [Gammaproteobacteria bacterium]
MKKIIVLCVLIITTNNANAEIEPKSAQVSVVTTAQRAEFNYAMNCRGCHGPEAKATHASVPDMNGFIDRFLEVDGGRQYLIQVPGVSRSALSDQDTADILNWLIRTQGRSKTIKKPFSVQEVSTFRKNPLGANAAEVRADLIKKIENLAKPS